MRHPAGVEFRPWVRANCHTCLSPKQKWLLAFKIKIKLIRLVYLQITWIYSWILSHTVHGTISPFVCSNAVAGLSNHGLNHNHHVPTTWDVTSPELLLSAMMLPDVWFHPGYVKLNQPSYLSRDQHVLTLNSYRFCLKIQHCRSFPDAQDNAVKLETINMQQLVRLSNYSLHGYCMIAELSLNTRHFCFRLQLNTETYSTCKYKTQCESQISLCTSLTSRIN